MAYENQWSYSAPVIKHEMTVLMLQMWKPHRERSLWQKIFNAGPELARSWHPSPDTWSWDCGVQKFILYHWVLTLKRTFPVFELSSYIYLFSPSWSEIRLSAGISFKSPMKPWDKVESIPLNFHQSHSTDWDVNMTNTRTPFRQTAQNSYLCYTCRPWLSLILKV